jgi:hypothetical protein
MNIRCMSCGVDFDDSEHSQFCPHDKARMNLQGWEGVHGNMRPPASVLVVGPSIAAAPHPRSAIHAAEAALGDLALREGAPAGSFRTWIADAVPMGPTGPHDELPEKPALHVAVVSGHPSAAQADAAILRLPTSLHGLDLHYHQHGD